LLLAQGVPADQVFKQGSKIQFWHEDHAIFGYFLGAQVDTGGRVKGFFVFDEEGGTLHYLPQSLVSFSDEPFQAEAIKHATKIVESPKQTEDICGALATVNCLNSLQANGQIPTPLAARWFPANHQKSRLNKVVKRLYGIGGRVKQVQEIGQILHEEGLWYANILDDISGKQDPLLFEHLKSGKPAIIISQVKWIETDVNHINHGGTTPPSPMVATIPSWRGPEGREHAFLAFGMFTTQDGRDYLLTQDSDFISVIPAAMLRPNSALRFESESIPDPEGIRPPIGPLPVDISSILINP
jgi:hypothetical protein